MGTFLVSRNVRDFSGWPSRAKKRVRGEGILDGEPGSDKGVLGGSG